MNLIFYGYYLVGVDFKNREDDWAAVKIKNWVKGEDIRGSLTVPLAAGGSKKFGPDDRQKFLTILWRSMAERIVAKINRPHALIPIPGHKVVAGDQSAYRTLRYAQIIASHSNNMLIATDALRWVAQREPQRGTSGWRSPDPRYQNLAVQRKMDLPCVLFDDVCTSGSSLAAARWRLQDDGVQANIAAVVMRPTHEQLPRMLGWHEEQAPEFPRPFV